MISRITAPTSPRVYRHVALPAPSDREKTQVYPQRYIAHFPAAAAKYQSGESDCTGGISRCGDEMMRVMLYEAAQILLVR